MNEQIQRNDEGLVRKEGTGNQGTDGGTKANGKPEDPSSSKGAGGQAAKGEERKERDAQRKGDQEPTEGGEGFEVRDLN